MGSFRASKAWDKPPRLVIEGPGVFPLHTDKEKTQPRSAHSALFCLLQQLSIASPTGDSELRGMSAEDRSDSAAFLMEHDTLSRW